ncbi:hypothetical protein, partial [Streptomyces sp. NPDC003514]
RPPGDAAPCHGAADRLHPDRHVPSRQEQEVRRWAETGARAVLGDAAYEEAYAEGGGLSPQEAAALV